MQTWHNGEKAKEVKKIIDQNFNIVSRHLSHNMLALPRAERESMSSDYLSEGLHVFDTTENEWYKYEKGQWVKNPLPNMAMYTQDFSKNDWTNNEILIDFAAHLVINPIVQLYISDGESLSPVVGGVKIDDDFNITLFADLAFDGKVVVK